MRAGGWWRCAVKKREQQLRTDRGRAGVKNARLMAEYHSGGWLRRRKAVLRKQRSRILEQLDQLEQEAAEC